MERAEEMAMMGPGSHNIIRDFGSDVHHKMHFGKPYPKMPVSMNPPPGTYDSNISMVRPKRQAPKFNKSEKGDRLGLGSFLISPIKNNPTGGNYQKTKNEFG